MPTFPPSPRRHPPGGRALRPIVSSGTGPGLARTCHRLGHLAAFVVGLALTLLPDRAADAKTPGDGGTDRLLPGSRGQHALAVRVGPAEVLARACRTRVGCLPEGGERIAIDEAALAGRASATVERVAVSKDRELAIVTIPGDVGAWVLVLGASLAGEPESVMRPLVGWVDRPRGEPGARRTSVLMRHRDRGVESVVTATRSEQQTLCGRSALVRARRFDPTTMSWQPIAIDNLTATERRDAQVRLATRVDDPWTEGAPRLLRATSVASGTNGQAALTDGDRSTSWQERLPGPGTHEAVVMSAPPEVAIEAFDLVLEPTIGANQASAGPSTPTNEPRPERLARPRTIWLVGDQGLVRVEFPEDAGAPSAGAVHRVQLPEPWHTSCVALVLDEATDAAHDAAVRVAEIHARTVLDESGEETVGAALEAGGARADATAALLRMGDDEALAALAGSWNALGIAARRRAMDILAELPCKQGAPHLVARLRADPVEGDGDLLYETARARLRSCGEEASAELARALREGPIDRGHVRIARELALLDPAAAVRTIVTRLSEPPPELRASLRGALSTAAGMRRARKAVAEVLTLEAFAALPLVSRIDLLRAVGERVTKAPDGGRALAQVLGADRSFRTRYLLLPVAGPLALEGDPAAETMVRDALVDRSSPWLRVQAAHASAGNPRLVAALGSCLADGHPRVRLAALEAIRDTPAGAAQLADATAALLRDDPWTFVRSAAASSLGAAPATEAIDETLIDALDDPSPFVRIDVVRALGAHGGPDARAAVLRTAGRARESVGVRVAAIKALGELCAADAADLLTKLARRVAQPQLAYDRPLGIAALRALGAIHPADLGDRLAPLLHPNVPEHVRQLALASLRQPSQCTSPAP